MPRSKPEEKKVVKKPKKVIDKNKNKDEPKKKAIKRENRKKKLAECARLLNELRNKICNVRREINDAIELAGPLFGRGEFDADVFRCLISSKSDIDGISNDGCELFQMLPTQ